MIVDLYPRGGLVVIVGGGSEALKKVESFLKQDCKILVLSKSINAQLSKYVKQKKIKFKKIELTDAKFLSKLKPFMVLATTSNSKLNLKILGAAKKQGCIAYASDNPEKSDFSQPSIINIEDTVEIAISTRGKSPVMAKSIKKKAEKFFKKIIKKEDIFQIKLQQIARQDAKKNIPSYKERKKFLYSLMKDQKIKQLIKDENLKKAQRRAKRMLAEWK